MKRLFTALFLSICALSHSNSHAMVRTSATRIAPAVRTQAQRYFTTAAEAAPKQGWWNKILHGEAKETVKTITRKPIKLPSFKEVAAKETVKSAPKVAAEAAAKETVKAAPKVITEAAAKEVVKTAPKKAVKAAAKEAAAKEAAAKITEESAARVTKAIAREAATRRAAAKKTKEAADKKAEAIAALGKAAELTSGLGVAGTLGYYSLPEKGQDYIYENILLPSSEGASTSSALALEWLKEGASTRSAQAFEWLKKQFGRDDYIVEPRPTKPDPTGKLDKYEKEELERKRTAAKALEESRTDLTLAVPESPKDIETPTPYTMLVEEPLNRQIKEAKDRQQLNKLIGLAHRKLTQVPFFPEHKMPYLAPKQARDDTKITIDNLEKTVLAKQMLDEAATLDSFAHEAVDKQREMVGTPQSESNKTKGLNKKLGQAAAAAKEYAQSLRTTATQITQGRVTDSKDLQKKATEFNSKLEEINPLVSDDAKVDAINTLELRKSFFDKRAANLKINRKRIHNLAKKANREALKLQEAQEPISPDLKDVESLTAKDVHGPSEIDEDNLKKQKEQLEEQLEKHRNQIGVLSSQMARETHEANRLDQITLDLETVIFNQRLKQREEDQKKLMEEEVQKRQRTGPTGLTPIPGVDIAALIHGGGIR